MTDPRRYITRCIIFLVLALVIVLVLSPVLWDAFAHNLPLNGLIIAVLLLGIVYNIGRIQRLRPEIAWIEGVRNYDAAFAKRQPPRLVTPIASALADTDAHGRTSLSAISLRHLLDSLSSRLDESRDIARYQTGLLIFLGLLGTFWGLLQAIGAIGGVISGLSIGAGDFASTFNDMKAGLSRPLAGMGTAFSSSLFGLAGSLVLGFLDLQASQAQNAFYNDLEEWLSGYTSHGAAGEGGTALPTGAPMPAYVQGLLQHTAENLDRLQNAVARNEEERHELVQSVDKLAQHLAVLSDQLNKQQGHMARLVETQRELGERGGRGKAVAADDAARNHLRAMEQHLARLVETESRGRDQLVRELRQEIRLVSRTIAIAAGEPQLLKE